MTNIGITPENRENMAKELAHVLADTSAVYMKTHGYHWNVEGPQFKVLHDMFGEQYTELWEAMDEIAERIRALDHYAPGSSSALAKLTSIPSEDDVPDAHEMVKRLISAHEDAISTIRAAIPVAQDGADEATADLLIEREAAHEKTAWMLRATAK